MPKPIMIKDRAILLEGLSVPSQDDDENYLFGAINIDGIDVSFSVTKGPGLGPAPAMDLLVAIEAISSRCSTPWLLPAGVHLEKLGSGYWVDIVEADGDQYSDLLLFAGELITRVADFVLVDDKHRKISILVGNDDELHYDFHRFHIELANFEFRPRKQTPSTT